MDIDAESGAKRNDVLSQSYAECVERVAQQKNDGGFSFDLPKEVLEEREKVWDNFFHKYANEVSDDVELDMNTMNPVAAEDEEDDDEEDEDKEYYSKCRAPLRKVPALIQYWIDTGNPPYQLVGDDDHSETGSSLSEGDHSRSEHSAVLRESSNKHKSNTSRCSSVDTAAYILSNANITKKAETIAIVEGAKGSDQNFISKASPFKEILGETAVITNNAIILSPNRGPKSPDKIVQAATPSASKITSEFEKPSMTTPTKTLQTNSLILSPSKPLEVASPGQQSVKLTEVLSELQEFDEMLKRSNAMNPPMTRLSLAKMRRKSKRVQSVDSGVNASVFSNSQKKLQNRRRLYTGRDSPVDLVLERPNSDVVQTNRRSLHPALETTISQGNKVNGLTSRARTRRKRKRASQIFRGNSQDEKNSQESDQLIGEENSKGDMRYTDFFESLGLTPSKLVVGKSSVRKAPVKRSKEIERQILPRKAKNVATVNDSLESSIKESGNASQTEDSVFSPAGKAQNSEKKLIENTIGGKILRVKIERLSDDCLAGYSREIPSKSTKNKEFKENDMQICTTLSGSSPGKKERRSNLENIELLTTLTHDSDSSTILICSCNENDEKAKKMSLRTRESKLPKKDVTHTVKSKIIENLNNKLPVAFVKLEKLKINNLNKSMKTANNSRKKRKSENSIARKGRKMTFKTSLSPQNQRAKSSVRNEKKIDLFGCNANESVTIGSRIFGESNSSETAEKSGLNVPVKRARYSLGIFISSDEEEDSFVKIVSEIGSKRDSTKLEETKQQEKKKINDSDRMENLSNGDEKIQIKKSQKLFPISTSSDDEDIYVGESKRRIRSLNSRNDEKRRVRRKKGDDLVKEMKNVNEAVKLDNRLDESNRRKLIIEKAAKDEELIEEVESEKTRVNKELKESTKSTFSARGNEAGMKIKDSETQGNNDFRRSTRHKLSASWPPKNQVPAMNSFTKPKDTKNLSARLQESRLTNAEDFPAWENYNLCSKDENFNGVNVLEIGDQSEKSKSWTTSRAERNDERIIRNSLRFQTRIDSDSDTEFESLKFSVNDKYIQPNPNEQSNEAKITESNGAAVSHENEPEIENTMIKRTSPRRIFKSLLDRRRGINGKKQIKRGRNLFNDESKSTEKGVDSLEKEAINIEASCNNNGFLLLNAFPTNESKDSSEKPRKTRTKGEREERRGSRKNLRKSDRSKKQSPVANQRNGKSRTSPQTKKKKIRRTRILGNAMEWESEDDTDSNKSKVHSSNAKQGKGLESLTNGDSSKQLSDKDPSNDRESSKKQQESSKSLFSTSFDDTVEDVDLLFSKDTKSRGLKNSIIIDKLIFTSGKKHKNLNNVGLSTMSFRTRLSPDTEDDGQS